MGNRVFTSNAVLVVYSLFPLTGSCCIVVVLFLQGYRASRYSVDGCAEKELPDIISPCVPSCVHAQYMVVGHHVYPGRFM